MLSLKQIEIFTLAAKYLNFSKAAKQLHLSPPAVTKQLNNLEAHCGTPLFKQVGRRMTLTPAGEKVLQHTNSINSEIYKLQAMIDNNFAEQVEHLRISFGPAYDSLLFSLIKEFRLRHPEINVDFLRLDRDQLNAVKTNEIDLCVTAHRIHDRDLEEQPFYKTSLDLYDYNTSKTSKLNKVTAKMLANRTLILPRKQGTLSDILDQFLKKHHLDDNRVIELDSFPTVYTAIAAGLGIGFLPADLSMIKDPVQKIPLPVAMPTYMVNFVYSRKRPLSTQAKLLIDYLIEQVKKQQLTK